MKTYGLIGFPLSHSFSPKYFEEKFRKEKISNAQYKLFPLKKIEDFSNLLKKEPSLCGLNVTIPYKESIIPFLDELDETAKKIGAVNCIKRWKTEDRRWKTKGFNTDVSGFGDSLKKHLKPHHKKALILGTGGASKAIAFVLKKMKIKFLFVSRKSISHQHSIINYRQIDKPILQSRLLIVNATPLGMFPNEKRFPPLPFQFISEKHLLFDLVYNPSETWFMKKGEKKNATVVNGLEMLQLQAGKSWEIWNGITG